MDDALTLRLTVTALFILLSWLFLRAYTHREAPALRTVAILVLGDIGRSPRMMYHAESFATNNYETFLIGYGGSKPSPTLRSLPHIHFLYLSEPPRIVTKLPFIICAPIKIIHQIATILAALLVRVAHPPEYIMVQNPPSIPTLALVWLVGRLRGSKVIIDWHNLGYSILALKLGPEHILVRIAKKFEAYFGQTAYAHLFVTNAMRDYLVKEWDLQGHKAVLHDRPPSHFHRCSPQEMHELYLRLERSNTAPAQTDFFPPYNAPYSTPFTSTHTTNSATATSSSNIPSSSQSISAPSTSFSAQALGSPSPPYERIQPPEYRPDRPALLVSSTSWTPDEDFGMLLEALTHYEARAKEVNRGKEAGAVGGLPKVVMIVTGKGPLKAKYVKEMDALQGGETPWEWVRLHELVKTGVNGLTFTSAPELAAQLQTLLAGFPIAPALTSLRKSLIDSSGSEARGRAEGSRTGQYSGVAEEGTEWVWNSWDDNWNAVVRPLISRDYDAIMEDRL
ncbi:hypothetical protein HWV62_38534 [Athelia sp. TMB]|nr:hypothetical protein HWV62_38534 [Athelia sp. TMB]